MTNESLLQTTEREMLRLRRLADRALAQVPDAAFFACPDPEVNSAAVLVKHLSANMTTRWGGFLTSDGEAGRDRDVEFLITEDDTRASLQQKWREGWDVLLGALGSLAESDLDRVVRIRDEPHTVLQAIQRQLVHCAYHVGQLVYACKSGVGADWQSLSIPRGQSASFNDRGGAYLEQKS